MIIDFQEKTILTSLFQTRKPGYGSCSNPDFRVWNFFNLYFMQM